MQACLTPAKPFIASRCATVSLTRALSCTSLVLTRQQQLRRHLADTARRLKGREETATAIMSSELPCGSRPPPAAVGDGLERVQTPALLIDRDALLHNLRTLPSLLPPDAGVRIRAHFKAHKCGAIAKLQLDEGQAHGFCFQKVSEVEGLLRHFEGLDQESGSLDLLVTNEVVERSKLRRLCQLTHHRLIRRLGVAVDDAHVFETLLEEAKAEKAKKLAVVIEIDVGQQRCGIDVESTTRKDAFIDLARRVMTAHNDPDGHICFLGLQAYHGANQHVRLAADRERTVKHMTSLVQNAMELLKSHNCMPDGEFLVTGGGTGSFLYEARSGIYNEIQPGSYALMDRDYALNMNAENTTESPFKHSLFILSTVISTAGASRGWVTLDAGLKAYAVDSGMPVVWDNDEVDCVCAGDEHTKLIPRKEGNLSALAKYKAGDRVWLVPGHCDPTCNLYDWIVAVQENKVTDLWPVSARGPGM